MYKKKKPKTKQSTIGRQEKTTTSKNQGKSNRKITFVMQLRKKGTFWLLRLGKW